MTARLRRLEEDALPTLPPLAANLTARTKSATLSKPYASGRVASFLANFFCLLAALAS